MKKKIKLFSKANPVTGGYNVAVKSDWGNIILYKYLSEKEKEIYLKEFGEKMITETEFFAWWEGLLHNKK